MMKTLGKSSSLHGATVPKAPPLDLSTVAPQFEPSPPSYAPHENRKDRIFNLRPAPVFYPTPEEFSDPLLYIEKIRSKAEDSGICKIVPPEGWKPDFALDTQTFWFTTRIQKMNSMEGGSRAILNYLDQLQKFHLQQGTPFTRIPTLDKKPIDLYKLKKEVVQRGGYEMVTETKQWAAVGRALGLGGKTCTSLSHSVKQAYVKWVQPYEDFLATNSYGEGTPKKQNLPGMKRGTPGSATASPAPPATPESRPGTPVNGRRSRKAKTNAAESISRQASPSPKPESAASSTRSKEPRVKKEPERNPVLPDGYVPRVGEELCEICGSGENDEQMLLCDGCNRGYHLYCLNPPMAAIPTTDWFCMTCLKVSGNDYGFEDGEVRSLYAFHRVANAFKEQHFANKPGAKLNANGKPIVTEDECEREFWRLIDSPYDEVEVEYGADLHSSQHGSGFPVVEKQPTNPYSFCGWNLNNIPVLPSSLFRNIRNDISGMMIPWLYVGMAFSTFCWHTEDHYTYSINYHHWGETKTWYGIPGSNAEKFEDAMKITVPELFEGNPDLLFHLTTLISPHTLIAHDVDVCALDQRAGEFVITFPRAYHAGFNHGFNFAEAVNFALPNWLPHGLNCVERYHEFHKQPVFSHDELVISTCKRDVNIRSALWLKRELDALREREMRGRVQIGTLYPRVQKMLIEEEIRNEEEDQCVVCHQYTYVSGMVCEKCSPGKVSCLEPEHVRELCKCTNMSGLHLRMRFTMTTLHFLSERVLQIANKPTDWKEKHDKLLYEQRRPALKELQRLLASAEKIPYVIEEAVALRTFIERAMEWVESANKILHKRKRASYRKSMTEYVETDLPSPQKNKKSASVADVTIDRTLENIEKLLKEGKALPFDCPEMKLLQGLADSVEEFRAKAGSVLADQNVTAQALTEIQEWGQSLGVGELPEMGQIEARRGELAWGARAGDMIAALEAGDYADLEVVDTLLKEGRDYGVRADHEIMVKLKEQKQAGERWRLDATVLLKHRVMDLKDIEAVIDRAKGVPVALDMLKKLEAVHAKIAEWKVKAAPILRELESAGGKQLPLPPAELKALVDEIDALPAKPDEVVLLKEKYKPIADWMAKGKKAFFKQGSPKSFASVLEDALANVKTCTAPGNERHPGLWCLCRTTNESGTMVACDVCNVWYHGNCVRVPAKVIKNVLSWVCPVCDASNEDLKGYRRPALFHVRQLIADAKKLPFVVPEAAMLEEMVALLDQWHGRVEIWLRDKSVGEETLKNYLRCAEGLAVAMDDCDSLREALESLQAPVLLPEGEDEAAELAAAKESSKESSSSTVPEGAQPAQVFCICREGDMPGRPMIGCDDCNEWYHFDCVGLSIGDENAIKSYHCPKCKVQRGGSNSEEGSKQRSTSVVESTFSTPVPHEREVKAAKSAKSSMNKIIPVVESIPAAKGSGLAPVTTVKLKIPIFKLINREGDAAANGKPKKAPKAGEERSEEQGLGKRKHVCEDVPQQKRRKSHSEPGQEGSKRKRKMSGSHEATTKKRKRDNQHVPSEPARTPWMGSSPNELANIQQLQFTQPPLLQAMGQTYGPDSSNYYGRASSQFNQSSSQQQQQQSRIILPPISAITSNPLPPPPPSAPSGWPPAPQFVGAGYFPPPYTLSPHTPTPSTIGGYVSTPFGLLNPSQSQSHAAGGVQNSGSSDRWRQ